MGDPTSPGTSSDLSDSPLDGLPSAACLPEVQASASEPAPAGETELADLTDDSGDGDWEVVETEDAGDTTLVVASGGTPVKVRRRRRVPRANAAELRLLGRRALCKSIPDVASTMLKTVKLRILGNYLPSTRGMEDDDLTQVIRKQADKLADKARVLAALNTPDPDADRGQLKALLVAVLLQEETYSLEENRTDAKLIELEKEIVKRAKAFDLGDLKRQDPDRWHHFDTYRIVLEAAWGNDGMISPDEARLLAVLRQHLGISQEEHWLLSAIIKRFSKDKCALHTPDEVNEARKDLQRAGVLWSYRDETNANIDLIPGEIATIIRRDVVGQELQRTNFRRLLSHDGFTVADLRGVLQYRGLDRSGNKAELLERLATSDVRPSAVLGDLDKEKLSNLCAYVSLKTSGSKAELIDRLIGFYDDLTFEERVTKDEREVWYSNYELLAGRKYAELRAKKVIDKDLEIQGQFEHATTFLFEVRLKAKCDRSYKDNRADGRIHLENNQCLLWDCKSVEVAVNLQDFLEDQFEGYLRKETEIGKQPLAFLVIGPSFTPQSIILAHQFKARTNWDIALVTAEGLKHLADRWAAAEPDKPFPIRLFNRTEVIDKARAEFLLSLA
jgi:hypothetical protein